MHQHFKHLQATLHTFPATQVVKTCLMHTNLLLQLRCRAPHNAASDQRLSLLYPGQNKGLHALIFLHLSLCLFQEKNKGYFFFLKGKPNLVICNSLSLQEHLTFFSLLALSWTCCSVCRCSSVSLATASPSCLHRRGFCSPNSCTETPISARERLQHSHSSHRACETMNEKKRGSKWREGFIYLDVCRGTPTRSKLGLKKIKEIMQSSQKSGPSSSYVSFSLINTTQIHRYIFLHKFQRHSLFFSAPTVQDAVAQSMNLTSEWRKEQVDPKKNRMWGFKLPSETLLPKVGQCWRMNEPFQLSHSH